MWFFLILWVQDVSVAQTEPINAKLFLHSGDSVELVDVKVKGIEPYFIELSVKSSTTLISLFRISRITKLKSNRDFEVLFNDGSRQRGQLNSFDLTGVLASNPIRNETYNIHNINRIHFISGSQLRSCVKGHYEKYTPHPFCPVCGQELELGPFEVPLPESVDQPRGNRFRLDSRDPSSTASPRRRQ